MKASPALRRCLRVFLPAAVLADALAGHGFASCGQAFAVDGQQTSTEQLAAATVSKLTVDEKIAQLVNVAPAIPRLGVPAYN